MKHSEESMRKQRGRMHALAFMARAGHNLDEPLSVDEAAGLMVEFVTSYQQYLARKMQPVLLNSWN